VQLTGEEDQDDLLMIGGIGIFLPCAQEEAENCVAVDKRKLELTMTVRKEDELEQTLGAAQAEEGKESEHSEECLSIFSQGAEKQEAVALKLAAKEAKEQANKIITPWEMELEMMEDWLNNPGPAKELA
jgi:hypothetical protein